MTENKLITEDKGVYEALKVLKYERKNPTLIVLNKFVRGEKFNSGELVELNKLTVEQISNALENGFVLKLPKEKKENKILQEVHEMLDKQSQKGFAKYGEYVKADNLTTEEWIDHASEELIDTLVYLRCLKERIANEFGNKG